MILRHDSRSARFAVDATGAMIHARAFANAIAAYTFTYRTGA